MFISSFMALFPVANPVGAGFLVNGFLSGLDQKTRMSIIRRIVTDYLLVGLGSLAVGHFVLALFDLSLPIIQLGRRPAHLSHGAAMARRLRRFGRPRIEKKRRPHQSAGGRIPDILSHYLSDQHRPRQRLGHSHDDGFGQHPAATGSVACSTTRSSPSSSY